MKTMFFKSVAVLLFSFALIQTTDAHDRDFGRDKDKRFDKRDDDRSIAYHYEYRRGDMREMAYGHYMVDRCGRKVFVRDCR